MFVSRQDTLKDSNLAQQTDLLLTAMRSMASDLMDPGVLSDEQIEQLIQEAEVRARAKQIGIAAPSAEDELTLQRELPGLSRRKPIPKLKHGIERSSYIQDDQGVARVRPEFLTTKEQQTLADQLRKVENKTRSKKEVRDIEFKMDFPHFHDEIYAKFS